MFAANGFAFSVINSENRSTYFWPKYFCSLSLYLIRLSMRFTMIQFSNQPANKLAKKSKTPVNAANSADGPKIFSMNQSLIQSGAQALIK